MIRSGIILMIAVCFACLNADCYAEQQDEVTLIDSLFKAAQLQSGSDKVETLIQLSEAYRAVSFDKSLLTGEAAIALSENEGYLSLKGKTLKSLGVSALYMGDYDLAGQYFVTGLEAFSKADDRNGIADCLHNLALVHELTGDPAKAMDFYNQSLEIERELGDADGQATTILNIGNLYYEQGNFDQAYDHYYMALLIREDIKDTLGKAEILKNMAIVYWQWDEVDKAIANLNEAGDIFTGYGNQQELASVYLNLGMIYSEELHDDEKGKKFLTTSLAMKQETGDITGTARIMGNLGNIYVRMNDLAKAFEYFENALKIYENTGHAMGQVEIWLYKGRAWHHSGDNINAIPALEQCLSLSDKFNITLLHDECYQLLMKAYARTGNKEAFNRYFSLFMDGYDSSMKRLNKMSMQEAQNAYKIDKLLQEISRFDHENKELADQKLFYKMTMSAALVLMVIAFIIVILMMKNRKRSVNTTDIEDDE